MARYMERNLAEENSMEIQFKGSKGGQGRKQAVLVRTKRGERAFPEKRPEDSDRAVHLLIDLIGTLKGSGGKVPLMAYRNSEGRSL